MRLLERAGLGQEAVESGVPETSLDRGRKAALPSPQSRELTSGGRVPCFYVSFESVLMLWHTPVCRDTPPGGTLSGKTENCGQQSPRDGIGGGEAKRDYDRDAR